jgi:hypothetical protein
MAVVAPIPPKAEGFGGAPGRVLERRDMAMGGSGGLRRRRQGRGALQAGKVLVGRGALQASVLVSGAAFSGAPGGGLDLGLIWT